MSHLQEGVNGVFVLSIDINSLGEGKLGNKAIAWSDVSNAVKNLGWII